MEVRGKKILFKIFRLRFNIYKVFQIHISMLSNVDNFIWRTAHRRKRYRSF